MSIKNNKVFIQIKSKFILLWMAFSAMIIGPICILLRPISEKAAQAFAQLWFILVGFWTGTTYSIKGVEKLDKKSNYMFLANHQSMLDIMVPFLTLPFILNFLAKKALFRIPFFGWAMRAIGHIPVDRTNPRKALKSIEKACHIIKTKKRNIFGFPEGTRNNSGKLLPFKLGLFKIAIMSGVDIVPLSIIGSGDLLPSKSLTLLPGHVEIIVHDVIKIKDYKLSQKGVLADKTFKAIASGLPG